MILLDILIIFIWTLRQSASFVALDSFVRDLRCNVINHGGNLFSNKA